MGVRLHYAERYEVKYGSEGFANWLQVPINELLEEVAGSVDSTIYWGHEDGVYSENFEIEKEDLNRIIEELYSRDDSLLSPELLNEGIDTVDVISFLENALNKAEPNDYYVHFSWF